MDIQAHNSRAGSNHREDGWLNIMGFGDKICKLIKTIDKALISKTGIIC